jgi:hypothetical protein
MDHGAGGADHRSSRRSEVTFTEADSSDLPAVDTAYRQKYGRYASIVDHLVADGPRDATLQVRPA